MYFKLTAPNQLALHRAYWDADVMGLDPVWLDGTLTFEIGTGNIEKVSRIRDKYQLVETYVSDYEPTGYRS
mgnify:FL=1